MGHCSAVLMTAVIFLIIFYFKHFRFAPGAICIKLAHAYAIADIISVDISVADQYAIIVGGDPEHSIVIISVQWIGHVFSLSPFAIFFPECVPDVLGVTDITVIGVFGMVLHNKK